MPIKKRKPDYIVDSMTLPTRNVYSIKIDLRGAKSNAIDKQISYDVDDKIVKTHILYDENTTIDLDAFSANVYRDFTERAHYAFYPTREKIGNGNTDGDLTTTSIDHLANVTDYINRNMDDFDRKNELIDEIKKRLSEYDISQPIQFGRDTLKSISIENFMPFNGRFDLQLDDASYVVVGNNRAGKSSFFDAIVMGLYGKTTRKIRTDDGYIHEGKNKSVLRIGIGDETIERVLTPKKSSVRFRDIVKKSSAQDEINDYVGVGFDDFLDIVYIPQGKIDDIVLRTSTKLKKMVSRWFGLDVWDSVYADLMGEYKSKLNEIALCERLIDANTVSDDYQPKTMADVKKLIKQRDAIRFDYDDERHRLLTSILRHADNVQMDCVDDHTDAIRQCRERLSAIDSVDRLRATFNGDCPIDGCECPRRDEIDFKVEKSNCMSELKSELRQLERGQKKYDMMVMRQNEIEEMLAECGLSRIEDVKNEIDEHVRVFAKKQVEKDKLSEKIGEIESEIRHEKMRLEKYNRAKREYDEHSDDKLLLERLLAITGKDGVQYQQLKSLLNEIENLTNEILTRLKMPFKIGFRFGVELRNGNVNNDIQIAVVENGNERYLAQDSGGGRTLIAVAMRIAVARYFGCPILFFDEVCGQLDDENTDGLSMLLANIHEFGIKQMFLISHQENVRDTFGRFLTVTKTKNGSTIG